MLHEWQAYMYSSCYVVDIHQWRELPDSIRTMVCSWLGRKDWYPNFLKAGITEDGVSSGSEEGKATSHGVHT